MEDYCDYLYMRFNVTKARILAAKYEPAMLTPKLEWISPYTLGQPPPKDSALFTTVICEETALNVLIDGDKVVRQAAMDGVKIKVIILNFTDTLKVLTTHTKVKRQMKDEATKIGLLPCKKL
jgi:hypothetical protein